jgi:hypothetical protein
MHVDKIIAGAHKMQKRREREGIRERPQRNSERDQIKIIRCNDIG